MAVSDCARGLEPLGQPFAGLGMKVVAQMEEFVPPHRARQLKQLGTFAEPLPENLLILAVIIAGAEMLFKVGLRICQSVFGFWRQHGKGLVHFAGKVVPKWAQHWEETVLYWSA